MRKFGRTVLLVLLLLLVSSAYRAQASTAAGPPQRGEGRGIVSGYHVSALHFNLSEEPGVICQVEFDLDAPAGQVQVSFGSRAGRSFSCANIELKHWHCPLDGVETEGIEEIWVTAVGK
jgi:hypothetical protein